MKCPNCDAPINIKVASKIDSKNCKVMTVMTSTLTIQCLYCDEILQVPVQSQGFLKIKDKDNKEGFESYS